jgi:hypothetical protein
MQHEAINGGLSDVDKQQYAALLVELVDTRRMHIISTALKTGAPTHMIDTNLPSLWRY